MKSCCRENDYAVGTKAINPLDLGTNPANMIEKCLCNHATVSLEIENLRVKWLIGEWLIGYQESA